MKSEKIKKLLQEGESEKLEFKPSLSQLNEIVEAVSAMANYKGGIILIGVSDSGEVLGCEIGKGSIEHLTNSIKQNTEPHANVKISVANADNKKIILIKVEESIDKPVLAFGRLYKRTGKSTLQSSRGDFEKIVLEKHKEELRFDKQICKEASLGDIDEEKVRWFLRKAKKERGLDISEDATIEEILTRLKLLKDRKPTNAVLLLFSKEPKFLQSEVKCIRFEGNEAVKPYADFQTLNCNVLDLVDRAENFVLRNIRKAIWLIPGKIEREEKYEYPPDAIRESIVNAVVHRDYSSPSKVQVRIFDNSIEIWNPGSLPEGWTVENLKKDHESIPKNPLLFKQFFWVKYVEDVGGGTLDMINKCREWGMPEPEFEFTGTSLVVTFMKPPALKDLEKLGLNNRQIKAVDCVMKKGSITNREYQEINNVNRITAYRDLADLVKKRILIKIGKGRRGLRYVLVLHHNDAKMMQKMMQKGKKSQIGAKMAQKMAQK